MRNNCLIIYCLFRVQNIRREIRRDLPSKMVLTFQQIKILIKESLPTWPKPGPMRQLHHLSRSDSLSHSNIRLLQQLHLFYDKNFAISCEKIQKRLFVVCFIKWFIHTVNNSVVCNLSNVQKFVSRRYMLNFRSLRYNYHRQK